MDDPREVIICHICQTPHRKVPLAPGEEARCSLCKARLYKPLGAIEREILIVATGASLLLLLTFLTPLVEISIGTMGAILTIPEAIWRILQHGYILVAITLFLLLIVYPLLLFFATLLFGLAMELGSKETSRGILLLLTLIHRWSFIDIFFIAIIVAMIKMFQYATIHLGIAFWALLGAVVAQLYLLYGIGIQRFWERWEERFEVD
ncbi:MAG: hypothetical protein C6I00_03160 [Nitratiruptor sp.]|nr:hypothetical protein [Nitratiruptor sp.]NPA83458.1 paraquat-inducible protein A [Campylobacterota bacterium]